MPDQTTIAMAPEASPAPRQPWTAPQLVELGRADEDTRLGGGFISDTAVLSTTS